MKSLYAQCFFIKKKHVHTIILCVKEKQKLTTMLNFQISHGAQSQNGAEILRRRRQFRLGEQGEPQEKPHPGPRHPEARQRTSQETPPRLPEHNHAPQPEHARHAHAEARDPRPREVHHQPNRPRHPEPLLHEPNHVPRHQNPHPGPGAIRARLRRGPERAAPLGQFPGTGKLARRDLHDLGNPGKRPEHRVEPKPGRHDGQGRASDGAQYLQLATHVAHRHGGPGEDQAREEEAEESPRRVQVQEAQARADLEARGQGQAPQGGEHGAQRGRASTQGARLPAQGAGHGARAFRVPDHVLHRGVLTLPFVLRSLFSLSGIYVRSRWRERRRNFEIEAFPINALRKPYICTYV